MLRLALASASLLCLPIAITMGVFVGLENQKIVDLLHGKVPPPSATNPDGTPRLGGTSTYCQKSYGIQPYPGRYIFNPNQWGDPQDTGSLCMNITTSASAKADQHVASNWTATWHYPQGPSEEPVHAFPNAQLNSSALPIQLASLSNLNVDVQWSYSTGNVTNTGGLDESAMTAIGLNANVAVDMFLSSDQTKASNTTAASHEVMVWLGQFGLATQPLGFGDGAADSIQVGGTTYNLYVGTHSGQQVFTWMASENITSFSGDISPFITELSKIANGPQPADYLGYYAFGSETLYASSYVTLTVPKLELDVNGN